ncbi:hypothetical protein V6C42_06470 [Pseudoclostridium thermosuccinogenes]|uniref:hypothetical protein n=1 Tax=Clostridium thermosuccinogenes TaxID=84032 RepID=UPI001875155F|nr:hypothetical protein [Pseudoclostridium thermosuccinogenes]
MEIELALREENKNDFWIHLEKAKAINLNEIIFAEEIEKHKEDILYNWYKDKEHQDISSNKLVTIESTMNFVEDATNFVVSKLINCV